MTVIKTKDDGWTEISVEDARAYYSGWFYEIRQAHWPAVGIQRLVFMDAEKTRVVRAAWEERNPRYRELHPVFFGKKKKVQHLPDYKEWQRLAKERLSKTYTYSAFGLSSPIVLGFQVGDLFHGQDGSILQVIATGQLLEVKHTSDKRSLGYWIGEVQLAEWLQSGMIPDDKYRISKNQSHSEIAKFHEYTE